MADKADAVSTLQDITEYEFKQAYKAPNKVVRNPGKVFDVGNIHYLDHGTNGKLSFQKITIDENKKHQFLHWYNAEGGESEMFSAGSECFWGLSKQLRESRDSGQQFALQGQCAAVLEELSLAASIAKDAADEMVRMGLQVVSADLLEIERMRNRYNKLVENVNAYTNAVNEYIDTTNRIFATNRLSAPKITLAPVRVQPITCTGNTLAFSQATTYPNSTDTMTNAMTTVHCE